MALTVYLYSDGAVAESVFNSVSAFFGGGNNADVHIMISVALILSAVGASARYMMGGRNPIVFARWMAVYLLVSTVLIKPFPQPVQIIDLSDPMATHIVDNVPIGVAVPAYFASTLLYGITGDIEDVYHTPNELDYTQTGMLFGAKLFGITTQSQIYNSQIQQTFNQFVANCIVPDVARGKYTWSDLSSSNDLVSFFQNASLSPLYSVNIGGNFQTCQQAWPIIQGMLNGQVTQTMTDQAKAIFPDSAVNQGKMNNDISAAYNFYFNNLSMSSQQLMQQNILANSIVNAGVAFSATTDALAAQVNYTTATSEARQDLSFLSLGQMAADMLPLMQTIFFLFLVGVFPLIAMLATIESLTFSILKNYFYGFLFLCAWAVQYDILNYIMNSHIEKYFSSYSGVTISNLSALHQMAYHAQAYCGYLMMAVPFLTIALFKGMASTISSMSQYLGGASHGFSASAAAEAAAGNFSMGDTSLGNHSWNNVSANKFDTNTSQGWGSTSLQTASGAMASIMPNGNQVYNASPALSHMPSNVSTTENFQAAAQDRYSKDMSDINSIQQERQQLISDTMNKSMQLSQQLSSSESVGTGASYGDQSSIGSTVNSLVDHLKSYTQGTSTSHENLSNMQTSANAGAAVGGGMGAASASAGIGANAQSSDQVQTSLSSSQHENADIKDSIAHDISKLSQASTNTHGELSNSNTRQLVNDIQSNWSKIDQLSRQESSLQQDAQSMQHAVEMSKTSGFSMNDESINNLVLEKATVTKNPLIIDAVTNPNPTENQRYIRDNFAKNVMESEVLPSLGQYTSIGSQVAAGGQSVRDSFTSSNSHQGFNQQASSLESAASVNQSSIKSGYSSIGSTPSYQSVTGTAQNQIGSAGGQIGNKEQSLQQQNQVVQNTVSDNQKKMDENANKGALHTATDHAGSAEANAIADLTGSEKLKNAAHAIDIIQNRDYIDPSKNGGNK